jgi:hypothetical protein
MSKLSMYVLTMVLAESPRAVSTVVEEVQEVSTNLRGRGAKPVTATARQSPKCFDVHSRHHQNQLFKRLFLA